jgi:hypothetical protein
MAGKTLAASQVKVATGSASRECCPSETLAANRSSSQVKVATGEQLRDKERQRGRRGREERGGRDLSANLRGSARMVRGEGLVSKSAALRAWRRHLPSAHSHLVSKVVERQRETKRAQRKGARGRGGRGLRANLREHARMVRGEVLVSTSAARTAWSTLLCRRE